MSLDTILVSLAAAGRGLVENHLVRDSGGNISARWQNKIYISPTGAALDHLGAADFVAMEMDRENTWQLRRASSEYSTHLACYRARPDVGAVFHIHPPNGIALGCAGLSLRAITPDFYLAVGAEIPLLPYITPTTRELADSVGQLISQHDAVLLRNHGLILTAGSPDQALAHSLLVEEAARIVLLALAATGTYSYLDAEQLAHLVATTGRYHRSSPSAGPESAN